MKKTILTILCLSALLACKKEKVEGPPGPQGPAGANGSNSTGTIRGTVPQFDQYSVKQSSGLNTTTVSVDGTNISTVTDAEGKYGISGLAPGVYDLSYIKPGCGLAKMQQIVFPGNGTLSMNCDVYEKPSYSFSNGFAKDTIMFGAHYLKYGFQLAPVNKTRYYLVLYSNTSSVNIADPLSYFHSSQNTIFSNASTVSSQSQFTGGIFDEFDSGATLYLKFYPMSNSARYTDLVTGEDVYTNVGTPLPTYTVTVP
jgi:hypothetical protein